MPARTMQDLMGCVNAAWKAYKSLKLNDNFVTLQEGLESFMKAHVGNNFKLPLVGNQRRRYAGQPITDIKCNCHVCDLASNLLRES